MGAAAERAGRSQKGRKEEERESRGAPETRDGDSPSGLPGDRRPRGERVSVGAGLRAGGLEPGRAASIPAAGAQLPRGPATPGRRPGSSAVTAPGSSRSGLRREGKGVSVGSPRSGCFYSEPVQLPGMAAAGRGWAGRCGRRAAALEEPGAGPAPHRWGICGTGGGLPGVPARRLRTPGAGWASPV